MTGIHLRAVKGYPHRPVAPHDWNRARTFKMLHRLVFAGLLAAVFRGITARTADAIGMRLGKPGIASPHTGENGKRDATVEAMNKVFREHASQFVGGHYCNAHSVLHYAGGTRTVNLLLDELSR